MTATPYTQASAGGTRGTAKTQSFTVVDQTTLSPTVVSLTLINADTDSPIPGYDPLPNGATLNLATLPTRRLNIRANTSPSTIGSVRFGYDSNANYRIENENPYALASDSAGYNYTAWTPSLGTHSVTATPYTQAYAGGTRGTAKTQTLTVVDQTTLSPTVVRLDPHQRRYRLAHPRVRSLAERRHAEPRHAADPKTQHPREHLAVHHRQRAVRV